MDNCCSDVEAYYNVSQSGFKLNHTFCQISQKDRRLTEGRIRRLVSRNLDQPCLPSGVCSTLTRTDDLERKFNLTQTRKLQSVPLPLLPTPLPLKMCGAGASSSQGKMIDFQND